MGFFSKVKETLLGDEGEGQAAVQTAQNRASREFFAQQARQARGDILPLFEAGDVARQATSQAALDVLGGALPSQLSAFQQGNVGAQQALLGGEFTPQAINFDTRFIPSQLPQFASAEEIQQQNLAQALGGIDTDVDLFLAASQGVIPGFSDRDQRFFGRHARELARKGGGTAFIDDPGNRDFLGRSGGLNPTRELRVANLLDKFQAGRG